jgi:ParB family transcriptional regulator, chromosome partitioning protein
MEIEISKIIVNGRHRKDLGDVAALAESIRRRGLLHAIAVTPEYHLVAGARRLAALRQLGWKKAPVRIVTGLGDAVALLEAERDENTCRKDFTLSEAVNIGRALEALERPKAKDRKSQTPGQPRGQRKVSTEKLSTEMGGFALDRLTRH